MKNLRTVLTLSVLAGSAVAAAAGYFIVAKTCPETAMARVWVDLGLVAYLVFATVALTGPRAQLARDVADMLRGISIGQRDRRLDPERFGDLEDVARAANEVAAALTEDNDPNIGAVRTLRRSGSNVYDPGRQLGDGEHSYHPEIGQVRIIPSGDEPSTDAEPSEAPAAAKSEAPAEAESASAKSEAPAEAKSETPAGEQSQASESEAPPEAQSEAPAEAETAGEDAAASENEQSEAPAAAPSEGPASAEGPAAASSESAPTESIISMAPPTSSIPAVAADPGDVPTTPERPSESARSGATATAPGPDEGEVLPKDLAEAETEIPHSDDSTIEAPTLVEPAPAPREGLRELFEQFITAKRAHDEPVDDLEFHSFATTLKAESEKLKEAHQCRGVRFEVKVQNGEVSLLPRLIR